MIIEIKALDTLFFGDGKPFTMGENHWTDSIFPPNMSTIYGAIRTAYFSQNIEVFRELSEKGKFNSPDDPTKKLVIKRMFYSIRDGKNKGYYYNQPLDLVQLKKTDDKEVRRKRYAVFPLKIKRNEGFNSLSTLEYILSSDQHVKGINDGLIDEHYLEKYIKNDLEDIEVCKINDFIIDEPKVGIGIDKQSKTSKESRLYKIDMKRTNELSICIEFEGIKLESRGVFRLGGEGKYIRYDQIIDKLRYPLELTSSEDILDRFKIILTTPAIFENGWLPMEICEKDFTMKNDEFEIKLEAAAVGKYKLIGGYDMANNRPKPMLKAVPAGSTYYFKIIKGKVEDISKHFHWKSISDRMKDEGYGLAIMAKWSGEDV